MFRGVRIYSVHIKPGEAPGRQHPVFIKEGFNVWAFIFTLLWTLSHRLWLISFLLFAFNLLLLFMLSSHALNLASLAAINIGVHFFVGFSANDWLGANLSQRGYILADISAADTLRHAEQRYFERLVTAA